jgi:uncharacterized protein (DUF1697 family)
VQTYVALLRGVMPSGKNRVPMALLREVLGGDGFGNVRTWIQSGNVILDATMPAPALERRVHDLIQEHIGPDLTVIVRTGSQLRGVLAANPFGDGYDLSRVFFVSFAQAPPEERAGALRARDFSPEELVLTDSAAYLYIPGAYGRGTLSNGFLEKQLSVASTMRNFNTMSKLIELSEGR